jgi:hypothetical protein
MDKKFSEIFDNWHFYMQKIDKLYERLWVFFTDLGIKKDEVKIIAFINSLWHNETKFYDSNKTSYTSPQCIKTGEKITAEENLSELFEINRKQSIFTFDVSPIQLEVYDEFGMVPQINEENSFYGIAIQYHQINSSKVLYELLNQISIFCRNVLDNETFEIEDYRLANLVYTSLKTQIDVDFYNTLAASSYERRVAFGGILLVDEIQQCDLKIDFEEQYALDIKNVRQIRKMLEMTADGFYLIAKNGHVIGIGNYNGDCDFFQFSGHQMWSYNKGVKELLIYNEGKYTFIFGDNKNFISDLPENFIDKYHSEHLNNILHTIKQQKYGTLLIISDEAKTEVERLCEMKRGYAIKPIDLKLQHNKKLLPNITSIDGAIFIDTNFFCYGVGIILDGIAIKAGMSSRGSRYNSAKCYIDNKDFEKFIAIVISEDETIDIIYNSR